MAFINCDFFSETLGFSTSMSVILPQETKRQIGMEGSKKKEKYPTLYLLHGLSDDNTIWMRRTSIERYVADLGIAVVMPNVSRGYYTDMAKGYKYFEFVSEELIDLAQSFFPLSDKREDNFVAGLSMGGYGAFKLALARPEKFSAAASLSGSLDMASRVLEIPKEDAMRCEFENIFGDLHKLKGSNNDLFYLADKLIESDLPKPRLYQCCGTEDFLYKDNIEFKKYIEEKDIFDYTYEEGPGTHEWGYWDSKIKSVLKWINQ
ncbi:S-formylglutathione hydrolase FrmB [Clostridium amylolyticum]|uniref:S-formylglutathione hydrolase FrmB n=1 Tax=Clostridium amylolyticum TaxID=1121298 RepID=A0A1M6NE38_9CLOT|nr:alpha/beta hydrolase family protein [Clostridium amylolyticum]SHJ94008.1 S-formylglutathione hydrolase FrmB [Clostridium amylolyticum]